MKTIIKECTNTYIVNKSKFISFVYPVSGLSQIDLILDKLKGEYSDATHICFAYVLSSPVSEKCSDDGEPAGTAGKPILELIKKKELNNVLVVVIRYFGGIKLGAGGLIRAYTTSAKEVIDKSEIINAIVGYKCEVFVDIANANKVKNLLSSFKANNVQIEYGERVRINFVIDNLEKVSGLNPEILGREMYVNN